MTFVPISGAPNAPQLDLTTVDVPAGSKVRCVVTATGQTPTGSPISIPANTNAVDIIADEPPPPGEPILRSISLSTPVPGEDVTATATIEYIDFDGNGAVNIADLNADNWVVEWNWQVEEEEPPDGDSTNDDISEVWTIGPGESFTDTEHNNTWTFDDYAAVTRSWANSPEYRPSIVCKPKTAEEVIRVLNFAQNNFGGNFKVRSGTHSYNAEGTGQGAVIIDMKLMDECVLNPDIDAANPFTHWMTVGGGALLIFAHAELACGQDAGSGQTPYGDDDTGEYQNVTNGLDGTGWTTPLGSCGYVGYSGVASAGGISSWPNRKGLMCDLIMEAEVVVPDLDNGGFKKILATPTNEHSALLNGLRGLGNPSLGIVTKWKVKVFQRKQEYKITLGLSWKGTYRNDDQNLWVIRPGQDETSVEWQFGRDFYATYQRILNGTETWPVGHELEGRLVWPHGDDDGIDGTVYLWGQQSNISLGWDQGFISYTANFDCYEGTAGLNAEGVPTHLDYLVNKILDDTIALNPTEYERFRSGTAGGNPRDAIHSFEARDGEKTDRIQWYSCTWTEGGVGSYDEHSQVSGAAPNNTTFSLNRALCIPFITDMDTHRNAADATFRFHMKVIDNINPSFTTGNSRGVFTRFYSHGTSPNGPIQTPLFQSEMNINNTMVGWRNSPNEIQMYESVSQTGLFWEGSSSTGWSLSELGSEYFRYSNDWVNELISYYGGENPRSYIGYIDSLWDYLKTPSGASLDINQFYYGSNGNAVLSILKNNYDPAGIFPTGPVTKHIDVADPPARPLSGDWGETDGFNPQFNDTTGSMDWICFLTDDDPLRVHYGLISWASPNGSSEVYLNFDTSEDRDYFLSNNTVFIVTINIPSGGQSGTFTLRNFANDQMVADSIETRIRISGLDSGNLQRYLDDIDAPEPATVHTMSGTFEFAE